MSKSASKSKKHYKEIISAVEQLSSYGFVVIPLEGKRPILKGWNKLTKTPTGHNVFENKNIGVLTGTASGITVLDIDLKDNGMKIWEMISGVYPEIQTPMVRTASGGIHLYFQYNKNLHSFSRFTLRGEKIGWDLMNNDRQVVAPPSVSQETNKPYKWLVKPEDVQFAIMPKWLEEYILTMKSIRS